MASVCARLWWCVLLLTCASTAQGQFVSGEWVQRGEASIRQFRMTPVKFLVLDAEGRLAPGATLRVEQIDHAFTVGWLLGDEGFPEGYDADAPVWRVFNGVALDRLTAWRALRPDREGPLRTDQLDAAMAEAERAGLAVRWGALLPGGAFDQPEWVVGLEGRPLYDAARSHTDAVLRRYGPRLADLDLIGRAGEAERFTPAMLRLLGMAVEAARPEIEVKAGYDDALAGPGVFTAYRALDALWSQRVGLEAVTVAQRFEPRPIDPALLGGTVMRLTQFGRPLLVGQLEVGGGSGLEASVNLETVVRVLFADPAVRGVYFAGLRGEELADPSAALLDGQGQPTGAGQTLDQLFRRAWWSDETVQTSELGEAEVRVFFGRYRVTATLADGSRVEAELDLSRRGEDPRAVVLQPVADATDVGGKR